ncbi:hypothetical protein KRR39_13400 [Nocardioides panacis]|jgi:hypothetical protein|uniref:Uncharacterized protein n=1 Tax=Nocardioides panacis TaxID=2849501 RepID=A0A975SVB5_9ACTN|nr:hypothetical protein [Nocardioides panacis]QWZ06565.1 hypothetical protein KRR39_13400 [Nocardioides panacis]
MSLTPLVALAATEAGAGINPWLVGVGVFVLLLALLGGLLAFGGGRDHS